MEKRILDTLSRRQIECLIDAAIDRLDAIDGDPDFEDDDREPEETDQNNDEADCMHIEDDMLGGGWFCMGKIAGGSGL
ncbi:hypothetical protein [Pararhizobium gei]|uniref:hypothetical protein n=1 Tax=Pararhizobium gei TaxID=1395951 RepID=UPI0023DAC9A3|nr:hypothetical protein [Rhizobium gei]